MSVLRVLVSIWREMFSHLPFGVMTHYRGVEGGAVFYHKCSVHLSREDLGHRIGSPEDFLPMFFPLTLFLLYVNGRVVNVEDWRL